jgi:type II secretory ATPase GspE/PulE/Tfp pilus assembly ATPase PilB-like protein
MTPFAQALSNFSTQANAAVGVVDAILAEAVGREASDIHFDPTHRDLEIRFRIDGVLHTVGRCPLAMAPNIVARLKVLAELLTYRNDIPQEGRLQWTGASAGGEMRLSVFPTVHGEKATVRLFDWAGRVLELNQLGLPSAMHDELQLLLAERSGAILLTGPSGSGKTTTIYACLRQLIHSGRHIVTLEDPVEQVLEGVTQAHARPGTEFDFARGLRSVLRQDPEVLMIGEIRDADTAGIAIEAALTGHLVFSTLHAGSSCGVVGRLLDMGVEPYLLTSGIRAVLNQRLVRRRCPHCETGCEACGGIGYRGRFLIAELFTLTPDLRRAILKKSDLFELEAAAAESSRLTLRDAAAEAVERGLTSEIEVRRVLGTR